MWLGCTLRLEHGERWEANIFNTQIWPIDKRGTYRKRHDRVRPPSGIPRRSSGRDTLGGDTMERIALPCEYTTSPKDTPTKTARGQVENGEPAGPRRAPGKTTERKGRWGHMSRTEEVQSVRGRDSSLWRRCTS